MTIKDTEEKEKIKLIVETAETTAKAESDFQEKNLLHQYLHLIPSGIIPDSFVSDEESFHIKTSMENPAEDFTGSYENILDLSQNNVNIDSKEYWSQQASNLDHISGFSTEDNQPEKLFPSSLESPSLTFFPENAIPILPTAEQLQSDSADIREAYTVDGNNLATDYNHQEVISSTDWQLTYLSDSDKTTVDSVTQNNDSYNPSALTEENIWQKPIHIDMKHKKSRYFIETNSPQIIKPEINYPNGDHEIMKVNSSTIFLHDDKYNKENLTSLGIPVLHDVAEPTENILTSKCYEHPPRGSSVNIITNNFYIISEDYAKFLQFNQTTINSKESEKANNILHRNKENNMEISSFLNTFPLKTLVAMGYDSETTLLNKTNTKENTILFSDDTTEENRLPTMNLLNTIPSLNNTVTIETIFQEDTTLNKKNENDTTLQSTTEYFTLKSLLKDQSGLLIEFLNKTSVEENTFPPSNDTLEENHLPKMNLMNINPSQNNSVTNETLFQEESTLNKENEKDRTFQSTTEYVTSISLLKDYSGIFFELLNKTSTEENTFTLSKDTTEENILPTMNLMNINPSLNNSVTTETLFQEESTLNKENKSNRTFQSTTESFTSIRPLKDHSGILMNLFKIHIFSKQS